MSQVTQQELDRGLELLQDALKNDGVRLGRYQLATMMGISSSRARKVIDKVKHKLSAPKDQVEHFANQQEIKSLRRRLNEMIEEQARERISHEKLVYAVERAEKSPVPEWSWRPEESKPGESMIVSPLSDIHFEEMVDPAVMNWKNAYSPDIAEGRLKTFFGNLMKVAFDDLKRDYSGIVMPFLGDFVTGWIHEELLATNAMSPTEAAIQILPPITAGIRMLADEFGRVFIPCVIGNHGRLSRKVAHKFPVRQSYDWQIYANLATIFANDERVTFSIPDSIDEFFPIYGTRWAVEHGNLLKGGSNAISGIYPALHLGDFRKTRVESTVGNPYDYLLIGDKHQARFLSRIFVNGSVIGYNEYAKDMKFGYEPAQQICMLVSRKYQRVTYKTEIFCESPSEPWKNSKDWAPSWRSDCLAKDAPEWMQ